MEEKNIIWDFDGTLYDTYPRILDSFNKIINGKYNQNIFINDLLDLILIDTKYCAKILSEKINVNNTILLNEIRKHYETNDEIYEGIFPQAMEFITKENEVKHFLVTHRERKSTLEKLEKENIVNYFKKIITKDDNYPEKPDPKSFISIISDILAGKNSGIKTIFFNQYEKVNNIADYVINDHDTLKKIL